MDSIAQKYNSLPGLIRWIALLPMALLITGMLTYFFELVIYSAVIQIFTIEGIFSLFYSGPDAHNIAVKAALVSGNVFYALIFVFLLYKLAPSRKKEIFIAVVTGRFLLSLISIIFLFYNGQKISFFTWVPEVVVLCVSIAIYDSIKRGLNQPYNS